MRFWKTELCGIDFFGRSQNFSQMICKGLHCCICYPVVCKVWSHGLEADKVFLITEQQRMNHVTEHILEKVEKEVTAIVYYSLQVKMFSRNHCLNGTISNTE